MIAPGVGHADDRSDECLLAETMEGDGQALTVLVQRYHAPLLAYLYRYGGDHALAEDLVQETFLRVLRQDSYRLGRPVRPWLYATATNLARDHFKSAAVVRAVRPDEATWSALPDQGPGPEARAICRLGEREVAAAVGGLGHQHRAVLLLRLYHDLELREIAETLGIPVGTVKSRLSVGLRRLRELLNDVRGGSEP